MKKILSLLLIALIVLASFGSAGMAEDKKVIKLWVSAVFGPYELEKPAEEWYITGMIERYEAEHPDIDIQLTYVEDQVAIHQQVKAYAMASDGPDVVNLWSGTYVSTLKDILTPLNAYMPEEDFDNILGWEALTDTLGSPKDGATVLAYPCGGMELAILMYDKRVAEKCGLDLDGNPPKTPEELEHVFQTALDAGVLPIVSSDAGYAALLSFAFGKWWAQNEGYERLAANEAGSTRFSEDEGLIRTLEYLNKWYELGYINKDYATKPDDTVGSDWRNGKALFIPTGNWGIQNAIDEFGAENVGILDLPDLHDGVKMPGLELGGMGQSLAVMNYCKYPQECVDFMSWFNNRENAIEFGKVVSKFPFRVDTTAEDYGYTDDIWKKAAEMAMRSNMWYEFAMTPTMVDVVYANSVQAITSRMPIDEFVNMLDVKAAEINQ